MRNDKTGLSVIDGGLYRRGPRLLVVDIDTTPWISMENGQTPAAPMLQPCEAAALREAREHVRIALMSRSRGDEVRAVCPEDLKDLACITPGLLVDTAGCDEGVMAPLAPPAVVAGAFAEFCLREHIALSEVAVISTTPESVDAMMEARWACALQDAGARALSMADCTFGKRGAGELATAIAHVARMASA